MPGIQLNGLASGLDTASIINSLMSIERQPRTRIEYRQAAEQARRDGLADVASKMKALKLAATDLRSIGTWADTQTATSSDTTKLDVRQTAGAGPGGYDIAITRLASSTQRTYDYVPPAAGTTLTFTVKDAAGNDVPTSIDIAAGASLDDAVSTINTTAGSPVFAVNVSGKMVLASRATGENARFTMTDSAGGTLALQSERLGQNALLTVDGQSVVSQSNTVTGAVPGIELTLKGTTTAVQLNVGPPGPDREALSKKLKAFVDAYNAVVDSVRSKVGEKPVIQPASTADAKKGALYGDAGLNGVLRQLRQGISDIVPGNAGTLDQLAELGISTGPASATVNADSVAGKLTFDDTKLQAALDSDPLAVRRLLGGIAGTPGIAQRFEGILDPVAGTGGTLDSRISSQDSVLSSIANDLTDFDARLARKEDALNRQYTALETALAQAQSRQQDLAGLATLSR
jgi:flagellar hook-associated protein 2